MFEEIKPTEEMLMRASALGTGKVLVVYRDGNAIRMETENGEDPYVWRDGRWRPMRAMMEK